MVLFVGAMSTPVFAQSAPAVPKSTGTAVGVVDTKVKEEPLSAEQEKMLKNMLKQTLKGFEAASLTSDQEKKGDEIFSKALKEVVLKRGSVKITAEMQKKQAAAIKEARESGKKGKQQSESAFTSAGFNEEQVKVFKETNELLNKAKREFAKSLKEEQIKKLPEQMQKMLSSNK